MIITLLGVYIFSASFIVGLYNSSMCSREIIYVFVVSQMSELFENSNIGIFFSDTINVIDVKFCMMVLHIELYLFITLSVTLTLFKGHSSVKQF